MGDSRILVGGSGRPVQLTRDHTPSVGYERQRITMAGGYISRGRVNGILEMTRSLGDIELKPIVSAEPVSELGKFLGHGQPKFAPFDSRFSGVSVGRLGFHRVGWIVRIALE